MSDSFFINSEYDLLLELPSGEQIKLPYSHFEYDKEPIEISTRPMLSFDIINDGVWGGKLDAGRKVSVIKNGATDWVGVIEPRAHDKSIGKLPTINVRVKHEAWARLEAAQCDDYDYNDDALGLADAIVNPWEWRILRNPALPVTDIGQFPAVFGWTKDQAVKMVIGTKCLHQNFFEDANFFRNASFGATSNLVIYKDQRASQKQPVLQLVYTGASTYATSGNVESIPIYNGDPNLDPMGNVSVVTVTLFGQRDAGANNPTIQVCRNATEGSRTYTTLSLSSFTAGATADDYDKWVYTGDLSSDGATQKNAIGYKITLAGGGSATTWLAYLGLEATTVSDTGVTEGRIDTYADTSGSDAGNDLNDGRNFIELSVLGKSRLDALADIQGTTVSAPATNQSPHWDVHLTAGLECNFVERRGRDITEHVYSFGDTRGRLRVLGHDFDGGQVYYQVFALGAGSGIARTKIVSKQEFEDGGLYLSENDPTAGNKFGVAAKIGRYEDSNIADATTLLARARAFLKLHSAPIESYSCEVEPDYIEWFDVGDALLVYDPETESYGEVPIRVVSKSVSVSPGKNDVWKVVLGQPEMHIAKEFRGLAGQIQGHHSQQQTTIVQETPIGDPIEFTNAEPGVLAFDVVNPAPGDRWLLTLTSVPWGADAKSAASGGGSTPTSSSGGGETVTSGASSIDLRSFAGQQLAAIVVNVASFNHLRGATPTFAGGAFSKLFGIVTVTIPGATGEVDALGLLQYKTGGEWRLLSLDKTCTVIDEMDATAGWAMGAGAANIATAANIAVETAGTSLNCDDLDSGDIMEKTFSSFNASANNFIGVFSVKSDDTSSSFRIRLSSAANDWSEWNTSIATIDIGQTRDFELHFIDTDDAPAATNGALDKTAVIKVGFNGQAANQNVYFDKLFRTAGSNVTADSVAALECETTSNQTGQPLRMTPVILNEPTAATCDFISTFQVLAPAHTHSVTTTNHAHTVTVPTHTHPLTFGKYQFDGDSGDGTGAPVLATKVKTWIDPDAFDTKGAPTGGSRGKIAIEWGQSGTATIITDFDITPYMLRDANGVIEQKKHEIRFVSGETSAPNTGGISALRASVKKVGADPFV